MIPDYIDGFIAEYPELLPSHPSHPGDVLYSTPLGKLSRILSFNLKGKTEDVRKSINTLIKVGSPEDILNGSTPEGKFILKRFQYVNKDFEPLMGDAKEMAEQSGDVVMFTYTDDKTSFTSDISNELTYRYPDKTIFVCRTKEGLFKCSVRSAEHELPGILQQCLTGLEGRGGGHAHACGLVVREEHFETLLECFKGKIAEQKKAN